MFNSALIVNFLYIYENIQYILYCTFGTFTGRKGVNSDTCILLVRVHFKGSVPRELFIAEKKKYKLKFNLK